MWIVTAASLGSGPVQDGALAAVDTATARLRRRLLCERLPCECSVIEVDTPASSVSTVAKAAA